MREQINIELIKLWISTKIFLMLIRGWVFGRITFKEARDIWRNIRDGNKETDVHIEIYHIIDQLIQKAREIENEATKQNLLKLIVQFYEDDMNEVKVQYQEHPYYDDIIQMKKDITAAIKEIKKGISA